MNAPRYRRVLPGQVWFLQRICSKSDFMHQVLTAQVDEVTKESVRVYWLGEGALKAADDATPVRIARDEFRFLERLP